MTDPDPHPTPATEPSAASTDERAVTDGRYLYCLVDTTTPKAGEFSTTGLGDAPVYVIETETVGAVVHDSDTLYDTDELDQVKQWLLTHQRVVDAASDVFGTPLPLRFDTILEGGQASLETWLSEYYERIRAELTQFAGTWEYRIHLFWDASTFEDHVVEQDDQLRDLQQRKQQAGAGKRFLLDKQYTKRLRELKQDRRADLAETLQEAVRPVAAELTEQNATPSLGGDSSSVDREPVTRLAVLTDKGNEPELGDRLDELVEQEGVEIRFTGPWPPYTFVPEIGCG